ncbi:bifunctional DNA-formamidopyrimidine glycosylase/DNA-(apurinic or apyrimidinic site) lyase [Desulfovibrio sp.]|uniref:bifunctional DNA-formamidopyrimidine glycosylase/DNA-(apurinic or apyrimidinic site) lyase n=1 Tax=Desulfovibrio sp. TaxID=885 RepID=UPI0023C6C4F6|nr:bifunctional DNA-formamidopyrimidine glycosylase/DNA-(apurinic or apyrimidinic site) lyase [Desulfovibrio sp.]MDE7242109.1 bifunctional DNA-formamidopyrimidine glycosylase/DNA-(apurinic or apyrimidinic site) lyase [Desulfovibrio sp.]
MPELPEVETVARTLAPHVNGSRITGVEVLRASAVHPLSLPPATLAGLVIAGVRRRGKLILLDVAPADKPRNPGGVPSLVAVHLRMTGRLLPRPAGTAPGPYTRWLLDLEKPDGTPQRLFFDDTRAFGTVFAATPGLLQQWEFWRGLGPEPLELTPDGFDRRLSGRRAIKAALLDQRVVAGIGNIYADEALHRAGIDPRRPVADLGPAERRRLLGALKDVLALAIDQCGSSIRDYRDADGNAGAFQNSFAVYGRAGKACLGCGETLSGRRVAGRATVFCPRCQR